MNLGSLSLLGQYMTVLTVAESIRTSNRFFADALLPSLTNMLANGDLKAASQIFTMNLRLLWAVNLTCLSALVLFIEKNRRLHRVPIVNVVRRRLKCPLQFSGVGIERHDRASK